MPDSKASSLQVLSERVGQSSESLATTSSGSSPLSHATAASVQSAVLQVTVACGDCGGHNKVVIPLQPAPAATTSVSPRLTPHVSMSSQRAPLRPKTEKKKVAHVPPKPMHECGMAGVPIVTPKPATVPRPFRFLTDKRAKMHGLAKKMFRDDDDE